MEKYIKFAVTALGTQTLSLSNVKLIECQTTTSTHVQYEGATKAVLDHAADAGETVRESLQNAMVALYQTDWQNTRADWIPPLAITDVAVSPL